DFDAVFDAPKPAPRPAAAPPPPLPKPAGAWAKQPEPQFDVERVDAPAYQPAPLDGQAAGAGIVLSPAKATLLTVLAIVALALAFGAGLLVGRYVIPPAPQDASYPL